MDWTLDLRSSIELSEDFTLGDTLRATEHWTAVVRDGSIIFVEPETRLVLCSIKVPQPKHANDNENP